MRYISPGMPDREDTEIEPHCQLSLEFAWVKQHPQATHRKAEAVVRDLRRH